MIVKLTQLSTRSRCVYKIEQNKNNVNFIKIKQLDNTTDWSDFHIHGYLPKKFSNIKHLTSNWRHKNEYLLERLTEDDKVALL